MKHASHPYEKQIFVCTNDAKGEKPSCGDQKGEEIFRQLREIAKEKGLHPNIRIAQAKCLGKCGQGCNIMEYPSGTWYSGVSESDVSKLAQKFFG